MVGARHTYQKLTTKRRVSLWRLLPWTGLGSLLLAFGCGVAALVIGVVSHGRPQNSWRLRTGIVQPSVLLSSAATLANALLRVAFAEGVVIQWWLQAHQTVSIGQLYALYAHGYTYKGLFTMLSSFSRVTLAALAMFLLLVDGPFLQRASSIRNIIHEQNYRIKVPVSSSPFVLGATGIITSHDGDLPNLYTMAFARVMQQYITRDYIEMRSLSHLGVLSMNITAPGWNVQCKNGSSSYRLISNPEVTEWSKNPNNYTGPPPTQTMFSTALRYGRKFGGVGTIVIESSYKSTPGGNGTLSWRNCVLSEALTRYYLGVNNGVVQLHPIPLSENRTKSLIVRKPEENTWGNHPSTLGGFWLALTNQFATSANISLVNPSAGYQITNANAIANRFVASKLDLQGENITWSDPTDVIVAAANDLSIRAAIGLTSQRSAWSCGPTCTQPEILHPNLAQVNRTLSQHSIARLRNPGNFYQTDIGWLIGGFAVIAFACVAVAPMYWGWWRLERTYTLDPLETAKAFDAPLLRNASAVVSPESWTRSLKRMRVYYGTEQNDSSAVISTSEVSADRPTEVFLSAAANGSTTSADTLTNVNMLEPSSTTRTWQFEATSPHIPKFRKIE